MNPFFWIVDVFSRDKFAGVPSAVFFKEKEEDNFNDNKLLQNWAMEINLLESAFVKPLKNGDFAIECYTPSEKAMYFGNSLFAAAYVIKSQNPEQKLIFSFVHKGYIFPVELPLDGRIKIGFPSFTIVNTNVSAELNNVLSENSIVSTVEAGSDLLVELRNFDKLDNLELRYDLLKSMPYDSFIITAAAHSDASLSPDFYTQVYAQKLGFFSPIATAKSLVKAAIYWEKRLKKSHFICNNLGLKVEIEVSNNYVFVISSCSISTRAEILCAQYV
ncbi:hypothetical protein FACS1894113_4060 [Alphaproteobacteria bacterium]|nr:hypothetical protein FACS1894113_4060 [Alphaproteobacteria bacterium]